MAYLSDLVRIPLETKPEFDPSKVKTALIIKTTPYNNKYHSEVVIYSWLFGEVIHSFWTLTLSVGLCRIVWASCYMSSSGRCCFMAPPSHPRSHQPLPLSTSLSQRPPLSTGTKTLLTFYITWSWNDVRASVSWPLWYYLLTATAIHKAFSRGLSHLYCPIIMIY